MLGLLNTRTLSRLSTPRVRRTFEILSSWLAIVEALCERFALVEAGKDSPRTRSYTRS
jgi:hypothetical protein